MQCADAGEAFTDSSHFQYRFLFHLCIHSFSYFESDFRYKGRGTLTAYRAQYLHSYYIVTGLDSVSVNIFLSNCRSIESLLVHDNDLLRYFAAALDCLDDAIDVSCLERIALSIVVPVAI